MSSRNYLHREEKRGEGLRLRQLPNLAAPGKLSQLNFSRNDIRCLPPRLADAQQLQMLDLSHNKIARIQLLGAISSLKFLNLSHNLISEVPQEIIHLVQLENLDLSFNHLATLGSIRALRDLFRIRLVDKGGFIEMNIEGNAVLMKKGGRDTFKSWMKPAPRDCLMSSRTPNQTVIARKRMSRSLQAPSIHHTQLITSTIQQKDYNHNSLIHQQPSILSRSPIEKPQPPQLSAFPQKNTQNNQNIPQRKGSIPTQGELGQWFCSCIDQLNELGQRFTAMLSVQQKQKLPKQVLISIQQQSRLSKQIILLSLQALRAAIDNNNASQTTLNSLFKQISQIQLNIKQTHLSILQQLTNCKQHSAIKFYKIWVKNFRQLRSLLQQMPQKIALHQLSLVRGKQIKQLLSISPQRKKTQQKIGNNMSKSKQHLNDLLFSRNKSECLLLSDQKAKQSTEKRIFDGQCEDCMMQKWLSAKAKQQTAQALQKIQLLQSEKSQLISSLSALQQYKQQYQRLAGRQQLIVGQLQGLTPSTYQHFLLQQAKTIQIMLNKTVEPPQASLALPFDSYTSKQIQRNKQHLQNTRPSSNQQPMLLNSQKVSEFCLYGSIDAATQKQNSNPMKSSYFKSKHIVTTINRSNQDPKTLLIEDYLGSHATRSKQPIIQLPQVIVSQFQTHPHQPQPQKSISNFTSQKNNDDFTHILPQNKRQRNNRSHNSSHTQQNTIQRIQLQQMATLKLQKNDQRHKSSLNKSSPSLQKSHLKQKASTNSPFQAKPNNKGTQNKKRSQSLQKNNSDFTGLNLCNQRSTQRNSGYEPMESHQAESYKRYMKYHLRNNIIQILLKKGKIQPSLKPQKLFPKGPKLIHKSDINKTQQ